ncbi:MAG: class I SAM-dependent methyltransferase [Eggerthellaceae bacterium]|nr:class I SAM-dependent methyltransferase [Eggerthellaceae bacterium]
MTTQENPAFPHGNEGRAMLERMNEGNHKALAQWSFEHITCKPDAFALDVGCGGGANIARLLEMCPQGNVSGIDYSPTSVEMSQEVNAAAIAVGRCDIFQADIADIPFGDNTFDLVTAFETIYFWNNVKFSLLEIQRVLVPGGCLLISNEVDGRKPEHFDLEKKYSGLTVYTGDYLKELLESLGFSCVEIITSQDNIHDWLNVIAYK